MEALGAGPPSGAEDVAPVVAQPSGRTRIRARFGLVLLLLGLLVASVPGLVAGDSFLPRAWLRSGGFSIPLPLVTSPSPGAPPQSLLVNGKEVLVTSSGSNGTGTITIRGNVSFTLTGYPFATSSLTGLVQQEPGWSAAAIALVLMAPFYAWWRRGGLPFGRIVGVGACTAAAVAVCLLVLAPESGGPSGGGVWWTVPLGASLMAAAFVVAPAPERRGDE